MKTAFNFVSLCMLRKFIAIESESSARIIETQITFYNYKYELTIRQIVYILKTTADKRCRNATPITVINWKTQN